MAVLSHGPSPISTTIVCIGLWFCCVPHNSGALSTANNYAWLRFCSVPHNGDALFHYKQLRPLLGCYSVPRH